MCQPRDIFSLFSLMCTMDIVILTTMFVQLIYSRIKKMDIEIKAQSVPAPFKRNPSPPIAVIAIVLLQ